MHIKALNFLFNTCSSPEVGVLRLHFSNSARLMFLLNCQLCEVLLPLFSLSFVFSFTFFYPDCSLLDHQMAGISPSLFCCGIIDMDTLDACGELIMDNRSHSHKYLLLSFKIHI